MCERCKDVRVLQLTQYFQPEPGLKGLPFARELQALGHDVQVITGFPNYPGGKLYDGYRLKAIQREMMSGVPVTRVPLLPSHDRSVLRRSATYLSFLASASTIGAMAAAPADVIYAYHPPITTGVAASVIGRRLNAPFVYDVQDLWPDSLSSTGMVNNRSLLMKSISRVCQSVYANATCIIALSPGMKRALVAQGVPAEKIRVVYNWCHSEETMHPSPPNDELKRSLRMAGKFNIMFAGNVGPAQALETVVAAAEITKETVPDAQFVILGGGIGLDSLQHLVAEKRLDNVIFLARRPPDEVGDILNLADVLLVHLRDDPTFAAAIPSKTQAYLAMEKPILMAARGDATDLVRDAGAGLLCEPESPRALADAVETLHNVPKAALSELGRSGGRYYWDQLSLRRGTEKIAEILAEAVAAHAVERGRT